MKTNTEKNNYGKKKILTLVAVTVTSAGLLISGCTPGQNVPGATAAGAVAGGLAGGLLFKGSAAGIIGGALLGGIIGNAIGNRMDAQDRARMEQAVILVPEDQTTVWTNTRTGVTYQVTPSIIIIRADIIVANIKLEFI